MLEEISKALAPWPLLQYTFTVILVIGGIYAIMRGLNKGRETPQQDSYEDKKSEWAAYKQLEHIEENTFRLVVLQEKTIEAINHLTDAIWNGRKLHGKD